MNYKEINAKRSHRAGIGLLLALGMSVLLASPPKASAQQYYDSFSKMLSVTSTMQSNLYSDMMRVNASKGALRELAGGSPITQQDIQNLCKPFPCGNEGAVSRPGPITQQDVQNLCKPFPCGNEGIVNSGRPAYPSTPQGPPMRAPRQFPITATDFRPVGGRLLPDELSRAAPGDAEAKEQLRALSNQFLDAFEKEGRKNNVANAFAFLTSVSIQIVGNRELSELEEQQLTSGFNNWLATMPQFASMTARDKQVITESAVISGGLIALLHVQGKQQNDAKMQSEARQMARSTIAYFFGVRIP